VNPEPANAPAVAPRKGLYLTRHWRGQLSLFKSFWLDAIGLSVVTFSLSALGAGYLAGIYRREPSFAVTLIVTVFILGICILMWSLVGLWRSARGYKGRRIWSVSARVVTLGWLGLIIVYWISVSHTLLTTYYNCATGRDFGELVPFFVFGPCEVVFYPKHGLVVRRLARDSFGHGIVDPFE
jgi:hypothetical protein